MEKYQNLLYMLEFKSWFQTYFYLFLIIIFENQEQNAILYLLRFNSFIFTVWYYLGLGEVDNLWFNRVGCWWCMWKYQTFGKCKENCDIANECAICVHQKWYKIGTNAVQFQQSGWDLVGHCSWATEQPLSMFHFWRLQSAKSRKCVQKFTYQFLIKKNLVITLLDHIPTLRNEKNIWRQYVENA